MSKIFAIWPEGTGQSAWRQLQRWMLLDVTDGIDNAVVLDRGTRADMVDRMAEARRRKSS